MSKESFKVKPIIEQKPFENPTVQSFFRKWCEINDLIELQVINREEWNKKKEKEGILETKPDGKKILYIPNDLQLWEIIGVVEAIDRDTFANNPAKAKEAKEKLLKLGKTFKNAGIYIAQRLNSIKEGKEIAEALALEFYQYGQLLLQEGVQEGLKIEDISSHQLTPEEIEEIDRFLAGETLYESRRQKVEKLGEVDEVKKEELYEEQRRKTLSQFFRAVEEAFILRYKSEKGELKEIKTELKPWQRDNPIHYTFLRRIEEAIKRKIEIPKQELTSSIFRRGMEILKNYMPFDRLPIVFKVIFLHWEKGEKTLREALRINNLKKELEKIRKTNDLKRIAKKELEIAKKIQSAVSAYPMKERSYSPSEIIVNQTINCVGASLLGGALLEEVGLNYLVADVPQHSLLFLILSNGEVWWFDMLYPEVNERLTDDMIEGQRKDGKPLTIQDIVDFSRNPTPEGLMFYIKSPKYREKLPWVEKDQIQYIILSKPEYGLQSQMLYNLGTSFLHLGYYQEAIEAYRRAISLNPQKFSVYYNLGNALFELNRYEEAIEAYKKFIELAKGKIKYIYHIKKARSQIKLLKQKMKKG